jgi:hypothetical protein
MKSVFILFCVVGSLGSAHAAGERIYKCGNEFTNMMSDAEALAKNCKPLAGGNVTVIQATKVPPKAAASGAGQRTDEQKAQDSDARLILEAELRKAEAKRADLLKEYNNGEPEKIGSESRNNQKYLDRVAELKAAIARADGDIAGIKRELARLPSATASAASGTTGK